MFFSPPYTAVTGQSGVGIGTTILLLTSVQDTSDMYSQPSSRAKALILG